MNGIPEVEAALQPPCGRGNVETLRWNGSHRPSCPGHGNP